VVVVVAVEAKTGRGRGENEQGQKQVLGAKQLRLFDSVPNTHPGSYRPTWPELADPFLEFANR